MNLGNTISDLRAKKGLKQGQFATLLDLSQTYLSQIENNKKLPNMAVLERISKVLDTPLPILFFLSIDEKDIAKSKIVHFKALEPLIKSFIDELIGVQ